MKIALISDHASPLAAPGGADSGGQNVYVANVARQLGRSGHRVDVFTRSDSRRLPRICSMDANVRVIHIPAGPLAPLPKEHLLPHMYEFSHRLLDYCGAPWRRYDVVHANFFMSGIAALRLKQQLQIPFVITFHALGKIRRLHQREADQFPPERIAIERQLVMAADRIIAECPQDRADLIDHYGAVEDHIDLVPCGVDTNEMHPRPRARERLRIPAESFVVLQLGRMVRRKGVDNVIRAIGLLNRRGVPAHLLVVGGESESPDPASTPEIGHLMAVAAAEGVADRVTFTGRKPREALAEYYSAADVFVTTPWYEPFGITPLEAMACGTPVVGAAVGGIKHTVIDEVTGFLVPPHNPAELAERLMRFHANPELARAFGRAGIRHVASRYTWRRVAEQLAASYERVVHTRRPVIRAAAATL